MQNLNTGKICRVADAVAVGFVAVAVGVDDVVGDNVAVAVAGTGVEVAVGTSVCVDVKVGITGGGAKIDRHANAIKKMIPMTM